MLEHWEWSENDREKVGGTRNSRKNRNQSNNDTSENSSNTGSGVLEKLTATQSPM